MNAQLGGDVAHAAGEQAQWVFTPPSGLRLAGATIWRTGTASGLGYNATTLTYLTAPGSAFNSENVWEQGQRVHGCLSVGDGTFARSDANPSHGSRSASASTA